MTNQIITLGTLDGKSIKWIVLREEHHRMLCVSKKVLFYRRFSSDGSNLYSESDIWNILNVDFFKSSSTEDEDIRKFLNIDFSFTEEEDRSNLYSKSDIRKYLNDDFFKSSFTEEEKKEIVNTKLSKTVKDNVFLLSTEEVERIKNWNSLEIEMDNWFYTRTAVSNSERDVWGVHNNYNRSREDSYSVGGILPAIWVRKRG